MHKRKKQISIPEIGDGMRGEDGYLGYLLRQAAAAYRLRMDRLLSNLGVTPPQFSVMTMIKAYPGLSNADIARLAMLTPQTVSVIVANLERAGLIHRVPHEVHGRILHIALTEAGGDVLDRCRERVQELERDLVNGLTDLDQTAVRRWLAGMARGAAKS